MSPRDLVYVGHMPRQGLGMAAALLVFLACGGAWTEAQQCAPNDVMDRCSPERHERMLELYGMRPIEAHRDAGDQVRRAFYVDGYDNDVVAISYIRSRGREPIVSVHLPRLNGERVEPLVASIPDEAWNGVLRHSRSFDRTLEPLQQVDTGMVSICLHPWVWTVEATDPSESTTEARGVRRRTDNGCDDGLAGQYADELAISAVSLLSYCRSLVPRNYRMEANLLADCFKLRGDRNAAAAVRNLVEEFTRASTLGQLMGLEWLFALDATIEVADHAPGSEAPERVWLDRVWGDLASNAATISVDSVTGESSSRVTVVGRIRRHWPRNPGDSNSSLRWEIARVEMIWGKQWDAFHLERVVVGPFDEEAR